MRTLADLRAWAMAAPQGTTIPVTTLAELLGDLEEAEAPVVTVEPTNAGWTWRERLWEVPAETRLGVAELSEALGRPRSYIYARTGPKTDAPIPHRKLDGTLLFTAGEVRAWIREREETNHAGAYLSVREGGRG